MITEVVSVVHKTYIACDMTDQIRYGCCVKVHPVSSPPPLLCQRGLERAEIALQVQEKPVVHVLKQRVWDRRRGGKLE